MGQSKLARRTARPIRDFMLGLGIFTIVACSGLTDRAAPASRGMFTHSAQAQMMPANAPDRAETLVAAPAEASSTPSQHLIQLSVLALALSSLLALNLWFTRHLKRVYGSMRRR